MIILASASPRRHELLVAAGIPHIVQASNAPEDRALGETAETYVQRLAYEKGQTLINSLNQNAANGDRPQNWEPGDIVLSADTVVCVDDQIFGKPTSTEDAGHMLRLLSGRSHWVHTGICLRLGDLTIVDLSSTEVFFIPLSEETIREYIQTEEPVDKAGAYAIQGIASRFVSRIHGCYHNVVGLPVSLVYRRLLELGWKSDAGVSIYE